MATASQKNLTCLQPESISQNSLGAADAYRSFYIHGIQQPGQENLRDSVMSVRARALDKLIDTACMCSIVVEVRGEQEEAPAQIE